MKSIIIIPIAVVVIVIIAGILITTMNEVSDMDNVSLPNNYSEMENTLEKVDQAIEQIENANPELRQIEYFALYVYVNGKGGQYYLDMYASDPKYKEWFDGKFPDITIHQVLDNIEDRKQFYDRLGKVCGN